jgi:autotransporter passenger strand-loop-strand repeat protein
MSSTTTSNIITSFTSGDIVVSLVGDVGGAAAGTYGDNQATPIELEEIDPTTGVVVGYMLLPQTTTVVNGVTEYAISGEYGSSSEGSLELSGDGQSLVIAGYGINATTYNTGGAAVYGNAALAQTTSVPNGQYTPVARVIADISYNGTVDTSTALFNVFNLNNPRSVATLNGSTFYLAGQGNKDVTQGVFVAQDGATSATGIDTSSDTRTAEIINGVLYVSRDSTQAGGASIDSYGNTLPTGATTGTALTGIGPSVALNGSNGNSLNASTGSVNLSPENFFFANSTTLYVADGGIPKEGGTGDGGLQKWSLVNGTWQLDYTLTAGLGLVSNTNAHGSTGLIGLTGKINGDGTVTFYTTNSTVFDLDQTNLYTITDTIANTTATQASAETFTTLLTAADDANGNATLNIRGVAFAPSAPASAPAPLTVASGTTSSGIVVSSGGSLTVQSGGVVSGGTILSAGSAVISGTDSATYIAEGGHETVSGTANADSVYGQQIVLSGGVVSGEAISNNGGIAIFGGATASATTVNSGATLVLSGGGTVNGVTINGGVVFVDTSTDSLAGQVLFTSNGGEIVASAGTTGATVISGFTVGDAIGFTNVGAGGTLTSAVVSGNTKVTVTSGATTDSATFSGTYKTGYFQLTSGNLLTASPAVALNEVIVSSGVTSTGLGITSGLTLVVQQGGVASNTTVSSGGSASIIGADSGTKILSGGTVTVIGTETGATISKGGSAIISGAQISATLSSGGSNTIIGSDTGTTIRAGAKQIVSGTATGDLISGTQQVSAGTALVTSETVFNGGAIDLFLKGAVASAITVDSGGSILISGNATATDIVLSGGSLVLQSSKAVLSGSLTLQGSSTISVTAATSAGFGDFAVISGFTAGDAIDLLATGTGAYLTSQVVSGNTEISVISGTGANNTQNFFFAGTGTQYGLYSATSGIVLSTGAGNLPTPSIVTVASGQSVNGYTVSSGTQFIVSSGGAVSATTVLSGGSAVILGSDTSTTIQAGGTEIVSATATGDAIYGTQSLTVSAASVTSETVYSGGGLELLTAGAQASAITINGGSALLNGNVTLTNAVLSGGTVILSSPKATLSGSLVLEGSGNTIVISALSSTSAGNWGDQAVISGFNATDGINITAMGTGASLTSTTSGGNTEVTVTSGGNSETFTFAGLYTSGYFELVGDPVLTANGTVAGNQVTVSSGVTSTGLTVTSGASLVVNQDGTASSTTVQSGGAAIVGGTIANTNLSNGGLLDLQTSAAAATGTLTLTGSGNVIEQDAAGTGLTATISGFNENQNLDLTFLTTAGTTLTSSTVGGNTSLTVTNGAFSETFTVAGTGGLFTLGTGPTVDITDSIPCFASGTRLLTAAGDVLVEDIQVGDTIITVRDGGPVSRKVVWTGRRAIDISRHPCPKLVNPVRIIAGAIAPGLPERDLRLSPEHAVYLDGVLIPAINLVNGTTIYQEQSTQHVTYHHIELDSHDVLLAEGLPCESYLDTGNRNAFETVTGVMTLHPNFAPATDHGFCAPLIRDGEILKTIRARLTHRATQTRAA